MGADLMQKRSQQVTHYPGEGETDEKVGLMGGTSEREMRILDIPCYRGGALLADDIGVGELIDMVGVLRADVMKMGIIAYCMNSLRRLAGGCSASL